MEKVQAIVNDAIGELKGTLPSDQTDKVAEVIRKAVVRGVLEGQHRAVDTCHECGEAEQDLAHKIITAIRQKNDALIANLTAMR